MADETVSMTALKYHTHAGEAHEPDDVYEVPADQVDNLVGQGMARRTHEPVAPVKPSQPVEPMTSEHFGQS